MKTPGCYPLTLLIKVFSISILYFSCTNIENSKVVPDSNEKLYKPPISIVAGEPEIVRLDTAPSPYYVVIPVRDSVDHIYNTSKGHFILN